MKTFTQKLSVIMAPFFCLSCSQKSFEEYPRGWKAGFGPASEIELPGIPKARKNDPREEYPINKDGVREIPFF
jgi:hypothetical protein